MSDKTERKWNIDIFGDVPLRSKWPERPLKTGLLGIEKSAKVEGSKWLKLSGLAGRVDLSIFVKMLPSFSI